MSGKNPVTIGDIEEALDIAARVIDRFGYKYWPIFERLEAELERRASREMKLRRRLGRGASPKDRSSQITYQL